jgi:hypothetical protein
MTVQVQDQQQYSRGKRKRLALMSIALLLLAGIAVIWIVNATSVLSSILSIVFTLLGVMLTLLQWPSQSELNSQISAKSPLSSGQSQKHFYEEIEGIDLAVNKRKGALLVYTRKDLRGSHVNLSTGFRSHNLKADMASSVIGRKRKGGRVFLAIFSSLDVGNYTIHTDSQEFVTKVSILPGRVEEVDWR